MIRTERSLIFSGILNHLCFTLITTARNSIFQCNSQHLCFPMIITAWNSIFQWNSWQAPFYNDQNSKELDLSVEFSTAFVLQWSQQSGTQSLSGILHSLCFVMMRTVRNFIFEWNSSTASVLYWSEHRGTQSFDGIRDSLCVVIIGTVRNSIFRFPRWSPNCRPFVTVNSDQEFLLNWTRKSRQRNATKWIPWQHLAWLLGDSD
jgi:hypothetical protein